MVVIGSSFQRRQEKLCVANKTIENMDDETIKFYDAETDKCEELWLRPEKLKLANDWEQRFVATLPPHGRVCDYGCGSGRSALFFAQSGLVCDAFDASESMVQMTRAKCSTFPVTVEHKEFSEFQPDQGTYDGVWASSSLLHAKRSNLPALLQSIHRSLKPGGTFYLGLKLGHGEHRDKLGRLYTYYKVNDLQEFVQAAGFRWHTHTTGRAIGVDDTEHEWIKIIAFCEK